MKAKRTAIVLVPALSQKREMHDAVPIRQISAIQVRTMIVRHFLHWDGRALVLLVVAMILATGCGPLSEPPPKLGAKNWKISGIGGAVELRPLPAADKVMEDYQQWRDSDAATKARLYEATLVGASNQSHFSVKIQTGDTPMGQSVTTVASFVYRSPDGEYELFWWRFGRHNADFLKLTDQPKTVWLQPNNVVNESGNPELEIVAFEGLVPSGRVMAE